LLQNSDHSKEETKKERKKKKINILVCFFFVFSWFFQVAKLDEKSIQLAHSSDHPHALSAVFFEPNATTQNLTTIDEISSLSPILDFQIADLCQEGAPQIYALSGRGKLKLMKNENNEKF